MTTAADLLGFATLPELLDRIRPVVPDEVAVYPAPASMREVWNRDTGAMTIGNRIFVRPDLLRRRGPELEDLIVHELVHVRQWRDRRFVGFLGSYVRQYLMARFWGARHHVAYMSIDSEVEARRVASEIRRLLND
ncbi:MAG TPA: DUF4157 domain-containing protein [Acidimicrobiia bacterium]